MATEAVIKVDAAIRDIPGECPDCGFDALRQVVLLHLTSAGVTTLAERTYCGRCETEARR